MDSSSLSKTDFENASIVKDNGFDHCFHDMREGDHVVRWKILGFCYPIQIHGIVFSAGPDIVTIVDCGLTPTITFDKAGRLTEGQVVTNRRRMNVVTLVDEKEIKLWKKIQYDDCTLRVSMKNERRGDHKRQQLHNKIESTDDELLSITNSTCHSDRSAEKSLAHIGYDHSSSEASLEKEISNSLAISSSCEPCSISQINNQVDEGSKKHSKMPVEEDTTKDENSKPLKESNSPSQDSFILPKSDPPILVLARLRFLLEYGEGENRNADSRTTLLPPHHIFYANSECIAVWCKTGHWCTLQASVFLHTSALGNAKQTASLAMYLSAQTVTVPASGIWGFFGGTNTVSLFSSQPWLIPALVGGGIVYVGLPMMMLWKTKGRCAETEKRLNQAFWETVDSAVIVELVISWSRVKGCLVSRNSDNYIKPVP